MDGYDVLKCIIALVEIAWFIFLFKSFLQVRDDVNDCKRYLKYLCEMEQYKSFNNVPTNVIVNTPPTEQIQPIHQEIKK